MKFSELLELIDKYHKKNIDYNDVAINYKFVNTTNDEFTEALQLALRTSNREMAECLLNFADDYSNLIGVDVICELINHELAQKLSPPDISTAIEFLLYSSDRNVTHCIGPRALKLHNSDEFYDLNRECLYALYRLYIIYMDENAIDWIKKADALGIEEISEYARAYLDSIKEKQGQIPS